MTMGRRKRDRQEPLLITAQDLPRSAGHPFYRALNELPAGPDFDRWIEARWRVTTRQAAGNHVISTGC